MGERIMQAKINCPHCGKPVTVQQKDAGADVDWKAFDGGFELLGKTFEKFGKIFKRPTTHKGESR